MVQSRRQLWVSFPAAAEIKDPSLYAQLWPSTLPKGGEWDGQQEWSNTAGSSMHILFSTRVRTMKSHSDHCWVSIQQVGQGSCLYISSMQQCLFYSRLLSHQTAETSLTIQGCPFSPLSLVVLLSDLFLPLAVPAQPFLAFIHHHPE